MENFFAKNLKYLRNKKKVDQQVMAEDLGVAQSTLSCWENGIRNPDLDTVAKIAEYLGIYDDFITKDLTIESNNDYDELDALFNKSKAILSESDKTVIKTIIEERKKAIDKEINKSE